MNMIPRTQAQIETATQECEAMVTKRAWASGAAGLSPIIGPDITADMLLLLDLLPRINRRFGLSPEQIDSLDEKTKLIVLQLIKNTEKVLVGKYVTKALIRKLVEKLGVRIPAKYLAKIVPFVGPVISGGISFAAMRSLGRTHIAECVELTTALMRRSQGVAA